MVSALRSLCFTALLGGLSSLGGCERVLDLSRPGGESESERGWVYYTSNASGTVELWAAPDLGGSPVRITDKMTDQDSEWLHILPPTRDGARLGVVGRLDRTGTIQRERHLWVLEADGGGARHVAKLTDDTDFYGITWEEEGPFVLYSDGPVCEENLWRLNVDDEAAAEQVLDLEGSAKAPRSNPRDANEVLFWATDCDDGGPLSRLDRSSGLVSEVAGATGARSSALGQWSADGKLFAYGRKSAIYVHDLDRQYLLYQDEDVSVQFYSPYFGNGDTELYVKRCGASSCGIASIDLQSGRMRDLELPGIHNDAETDIIVGWAPIAITLDDDGDGLANGIDPD